MPAPRRLAVVLLALLLTAACGGGDSALTTSTTSPGTTTTASTTSTSSTTTTTTSTTAPDTNPLAPLLADPVADPFGATGHHAMEYASEARDSVVSQDTLDAGGGRLTLALFDLPPTTTGIAADQILLEAWIDPSAGPVAPRAIVLYGLGVGGWNPYVTIDAASIMSYLETTTDYQARHITGPVSLSLTPSVFDWTGTAHLVTRVGVFASGSDVAAYAGEIECTFTGTLACETVSDDGVLRPGDEGEAVEALQEALGDLGYLAGPNSGIYDDDTEEAVRLFQRDYRLDVDGKAGPQTQDLLEDVASGASDIVMASQDGVDEVAFGTPADAARPALNAIFGTPDSTEGWYEDECDSHDWLKVTWDGFTAIFTDRDGSRQFDGWYVNDLSDLPNWLYFAGGIRPSWRWADFEDMGAGFDPSYGAFWYQHDLGYNNGRFVNPPSDPPAAGARIRGFGTGTGAFVSC
ncbi:MAG: putative peptidoglycan binding domain protein [Acidobacteria bacterium]|nr:putative peptidoglycan binding domain protein [Acidobacteriota bacterium]